MLLVFGKWGPENMVGSKFRDSNISHRRYLLFFLVFSLSLWMFAGLAPIDEAMIYAFDLAAFLFLFSLLGLWQHSSPATIRLHAASDDGGRILRLLISATITIIVVVTLARLIFDKNTLDIWHIALLVGTLFSSWTFANLVFAIHYAHMYYDLDPTGEDCKGLDFPGDAQPVFADFVNFSFVIGMTCQTADINISATAIRRVVTFHGLFAFAFNLGILALTINVIAGAS